MRPDPAERKEALARARWRKRFSLSVLGELGCDALVLAGCGLIVFASWLVDPRLGLFTGGLVVVGLGVLLAREPSRGP